jgi:type II secretory pathway pseudopilin PulG
MLGSHRQRLSGFTLIEGVLSIVILSFIGIMMAQFVLGHGRASTAARRASKAATLMEMVMEQYRASSSVNFQTLTQLDSLDVSPAQFFKTTDNLGAEGFDITTQALYSTDRSSCTVVATIRWHEGGQEKILVRNKGLVPQNVLPAGADVRVVVTANGVGVPGLSVSARSVNGNSLAVTTDNDGMALLRTVMPGTSVPIQITSTLEDYNTSTGNEPGYYADVNNQFSTTVTTYSVIAMDRLNVLPIDNFHRAGRIYGQLINSDDSNNIAGMQISLGTTNYVYYAGGLRQCGKDISLCAVTTDASGNFAFNNVIPAAFDLYADGKTGTAPSVAPGDAGFQYGYVNSVPWSYTASDWVYSSYPSVVANPTVRRMGWVKITPTFNTAPVGEDVLVRANFPKNRIWKIGKSCEDKTDASGTVTWYNVIASNQPVEFLAVKDPPPTLGYFYSQNWTCTGNCYAKRNDIDLPMEGGYFLTGLVKDDPANPPSNVDNITISANFELKNVWSAEGTTANTGDFSVGFFTPLVSANYSGDPLIPSQVYLNLTKPDFMVAATVQGQTIDADTNQPAPNVYLDTRTGATPIIQSDSLGNFTLTEFPYSAEFQTYIYCDPAIFACKPVVSATDLTQRDVTTNTGVGRAKIVNPDPEMGGYVVNNIYWRSISAGTVRTDAIMQVTLKKYQIAGVVTDAQLAQPVAGMQIRDAYTDQVVATTQSDGSYSGWFTVTNRSSSNPGRVSLRIAGQVVGGRNYPAISAINITIPSYPNPNAVPLAQNISYFSGSGNGI